MESLRYRLRDIHEADRTKLYKRVAPLIKSFRDLFADQTLLDNFYHNIPKIREYPFDILHEQYLQNPDIFLTTPLKDHSSFIELKNEDRHYWNRKRKIGHGKKMIDFQGRLRALEVGLGDRRTAEKGLKRKIREFTRFENYEFTIHVVVKTDLSLSHLVNILLDRKVEWKKELLLLLCQNITKWQERYCTGYAKLLLETSKRFPEWLDELTPFYSDAMRLDGLGYPNWREIFPAEMIVAGFDSHIERPANYHGGSIEIPVLYQELTETVISIFEQVSTTRNSIIEICFREMLAPQKRATLTAWVNFFKKLTLNDQELIDHRYSFIDLINSNQSELIQLGIKHLDELWRKKYLSMDELLLPLCSTIRHPLKVTSQGAFNLLKRIVTDSNCGTAIILNELIDLLNHPDSQLRGLIIKWFKESKASLSSDNQQQLEMVMPSLSISEQAELKSLWIDYISTDASQLDQTLSSYTADQLSKLIQQSQLQCSANNRLDCWRQYLIQFITDSVDPKDLEPLTNDLTYALKHDFELYRSADELMAAIIKWSNELVPDQLESERILASVLQFRNELTDNIKRFLEPLAMKFSDNQHYSYRAIMSRYEFLAYLWLQQGSVPSIDLSPLKYYATINNLIWYRRLCNAIDWLQRNKQELPLSLPTNQIGWLNPVTFAERFNRLHTDDIDHFDLGIALSRLINLPAQREQAWSMLADQIKNSNSEIERAICIALGNDEICEAAIEWFISYFIINPPSTTPFQPQFVHNSIEELIRNYQTTKNLYFYIFLAAVRSRFGLTDISKLCARIPTEKIVSSHVYFPENTYRSVDPQINELEYQLYQSVADSELFKLNPIVYQTTSNFYNFSTAQYYQLVSILPTLQPYYAFLDSSGARGVFHSILDYPLIAQRYFEAGIAALVKKDFDYVTVITVMNLIKYGELKHVEISSYSLDNLMPLLADRETTAREQMVNLLAIWASDGRCTPLQIATSIAKIYYNADKSYKYILNGLTSLAIATRAGNLLPILVIEQFLAMNIDTIPIKKLDHILEKLESFVATDCMLRDKRAIENLKKIAGFKKASPARDIATHLLARVTNDQLPLQAEIIARCLAAEIDQIEASVV